MSYSNATGQSVTSGQPYFQPGWIVFAGFSSTTGQQLWIANQTQVPWTRPVYAQDAGSGVYVVFSPEAGSCVGYSLLTGKQLWTLNLPVTNSYDSFSYQYVPANGVIYAWGLGGDIWAINVATGTLLWHTTRRKYPDHLGRKLRMVCGLFGPSPTEPLLTEFYSFRRVTCTVLHFSTGA